MNCVNHRALTTVSHTMKFHRVREKFICEGIKKEAEKN